MALMAEVSDVINPRFSPKSQSSTTEKNEAPLQTQVNMALLILDASLARNRKDDAWGFRMIGGVDHRCPFTIERVTPNGIAENAGVMPGDVILKVNGTSLQESMTHDQACQVILEASHELRLQIQRLHQYDFIRPPQSPQEDLAVQISQHMLVEYMRSIGNS